MQRLFKELGVCIPEILLPVKGTDMKKWSVIACDQYTSQPEYWQRVNEEVGASPSTLKLTFPEIYLKDDDRDARIANINEAMGHYLSEGILEPQKPGFILVDRSTPHAVSRKGLILAVDLECYDYREGSQTLIRATEGTVLDRIPPRVRIRENAPIELPHIMLLIDDPGKTVIEALFTKTGSCKKLYDFKLMQNGGHIKGWKVEDEENLSMVADALAKLTDPVSSAQKYGLASPLLFAVGDGNHSLASAKAHWENVKTAIIQQEQSSEAKPETAEQSLIPDHPARYALVEVVNVHDEGLVFEPIHRILFGVDSNSVLDSIKNLCSGETNGRPNVDYRLFDSKSSMESAIHAAQGNFEAVGAPTATGGKSPHVLPFILEGTYGIITAYNPFCSLEVGTLQSFIDELTKKNTNIEVDYIHGDQVVTELGSQKGRMGFYLPVMDKHDLFRTVIKDGVLPRKTFSMGEAEEKRYYLECRRIR